MCSVQYLREFVNERLTAAAEEIFTVFKQTIIEYEEEIDRQRRLLDTVWKPDTEFHRTELPQQHVCKEEVLTDEQLCFQERSFSLDQEGPEPPQIKEEQEELCSIQDGEQLVLKQETDAFMLIPTYEESDHNEDRTQNFNPDDNLRAAQKEPRVNILVNCVVSEGHSDHQLLSHNSHEADSQDQTGGKHGDSGSTRNAESEPKTRHHKSRSHSNNVYYPNLSEIHHDTHTGKKSVKCDTCGKDFKYNSLLQKHLRTHTGEKPYICKTCGKRFSDVSALIAHRRIHTGEKPYSCKTCGKAFRCSGHLTVHMRTHTGEKPFVCEICEKRFCVASALTAHMRTHTGEKPYVCKICGKRFSDASHLGRHVRSHTGK